MTFDALLDSYRALSDSERMKGNYFEQLLVHFLTKDGVQAPQYANVWLWRDWPSRSGPDTGIDLVAEREDGGITAIQAKFFAEGSTIQKSDIDSFISASGKAPFTHRLIVSTTGNWSNNAEEMLDNQYIPVQRIGLTDLRNSNIDWATYELTDPGTAPRLHDKKQLREHQHEALVATNLGFQTHSRGKLIMACGTGKTFTALKIAEGIANRQGHARILFMVPSLALMSQSLKEWSDETSMPMHAYAVCSDIKVGRQRNADLTDVAIHDLQIPATTDGQTLIVAMGKRELDEGMTVVFSTYQSIEAVAAAQQAGIPEFDLIICDEAHRTTGVTLPGEPDSHFVKIHDNKIVAGRRRLYMTATPRLYNDDAKDAAKEKDAILCSMDDLNLYGPVFHRIGFGDAVTKKLLTDYKVLILGVDESQVASSFQPHLANADMELPIDDVAKLIGCWNGLAKRRSGEYEQSFGNDLGPMKRAVAFNRDIKSSKLIASEFEDLVRVHLSNLDNDDPTDDLSVEVRHVDGGFNAVARAERLDWLKEDAVQTHPVCRILTNARCLTEGVDIPSLDAVLFLNPRNSMVDVIQAVGRVMRRYADPATGEEKKFGYIILPIVIPQGMSASEALRDNQRYRVVWQVLQALRAHDERMDASINQIGLNEKAPESIVVQTIDLRPAKKTGNGIGKGDHTPDETPNPGGPSFQAEFLFPVSEWKDAVYAKIVDKCGNRMYWADWTNDIADIAGKHVLIIENLLAGADESHRKAFDSFLSGLREILNPKIDESQAIEMLAQHLVTKPVFDAMFSESNFTEHNPVSIAMQKIIDLLDSDSALEKERLGLEKFYESVRLRVKELDNAAAKQKIIIELYDKFFQAAFPRVAARLGIVFTPVPVVDYILRSANAALKLEFGTQLSDKGVSIIDPFVGTGTFISRLLQSGLIKASDMHRKFTTELFANEIVLLSYYIAAINIETVYEELTSSTSHSPFTGISLTDTFQLSESDNSFESDVFPENLERLQKQKNQDIKVIVMNPPYSAGQNSANDDNQNQKYPTLDKSISATYAALSTATNKNGLYDSYVRGIRWATDRIKGDGVIAFVSNGSFIEGNTADGIRKTFHKEFSRIFVYNLRGNAQTSGAQRKREAGNVFGEGSRTQIAICILIKNTAHVGDAVIHYRDIGDGLSREEKLDTILAEGSIEGTDWEIVVPNVQGDWINARDVEFDTFQPLGEKLSKGRLNTPAVFQNYSRGLETGRDAWVYNFSVDRVISSTKAIVDFYSTELARVAGTTDKPSNDNTKISWTRGLRNSFERRTELTWDKSRIFPAMYRPFTKQHVYFDRSLNHETGQLRNFFPTPLHENLLITFPGPGSGNSGANAYMVDRIIDKTAQAVQCFALYRYDARPAGQLVILAEGEVEIKGFIRRENITDATLSAFREHYESNTITKTDIFYYVYGLLHSAAYLETYKSDLSKMLPRIPKLPDFRKICDAGRDLATLHVDYEKAEPYPLEETVANVALDEATRYRVEKMSWSSRKDHSKLIYNRYVTLSGFPEQAEQFLVNGKSAIEWLIDRYQITINKESLLMNDPNEYADMKKNPRYVIDLVKRIVTVSVETQRIIGELALIT